MLVFEDGTVEKPIPPDTRHLANETTSLCTPTALVLLSTDGYANSFSNEAGFLKVGPDIWQMMREEGGVQKVKDNLEVWLQAATQTGSGDDITLGILYQQEALTKELPQEKPLEEKKDGGLTSVQEDSDKNGEETRNAVTLMNSEQENLHGTLTPSAPNGEPLVTPTTNDNSFTKQQEASHGNLPSKDVNGDITDEQTMLLHPIQNSQNSQFKISGKQE